MPRKVKNSEPVKLMQSHSPAVLAGLTTPAYNMEAAARAAYESFVQMLGLKISEKVSDASGVHRIPSWDNHKTFVKARWRTVAQAVIDAATGIQRKTGLTSAPDVKRSGHEQDIQVRGRQRPKRRTPRRAGAPPFRRVDAR
jgi:hypothetical protein